jgi:hypothetical protein
MMDQTHIGYTYWQQPRSNSMPSVGKLDVPPEAAFGVAVEGSTNVWPDSPEAAALPQFNSFSRVRHYFDVFSRSQERSGFKIVRRDPWIHSDTKPISDKEERVWVRIDWSSAPKGIATGKIELQHAGDAAIPITVTTFNPIEPARDSVEGFVEEDGCVSMEAEHFTRKVDATAAHWGKIDDYGRTLSAMTLFPTTAPSVTPPGNAPCLEYRMFLFDTGKAQVESILSPTLNFVPHRGLRFAISFDDDAPEIVDALEHNSNKDWETSVRDSVRKVEWEHTITQPGYHTLKFWMVDPGIVLEKLVVNLGGVKPSYLGPPESYRKW